MYSCALKGVAPVYHHLLCRGERYNAIAAMLSTEMLAVDVRRGSVNAW